MSDYRIRRAREGDLDTLIAFTRQEAAEAEGLALAPDAVRRGVEAAFATPSRATYWVAEAPDRCLAASLSIVTEWSNFHGAEYWWIQSVFVVPAHRGRGLLDQLLAHVRGEAAAARAIDLRLYARRSNERALRAYRRMGFTEASYVLMHRAVSGE